MNPQLHDEFVALTALFYAGELTDEEWALLQVHLAYCDACRASFEQYEHIVDAVVPAMAASAAAELNHAPEEPASSLEAAEGRLMDRLQVVSPVQGSLNPRKAPRRILAGLLAACAVVTAGLIIAHHLGRPIQSAKSISPDHPSQISSTSPTESRSNAELRSTLDAAQKEIAMLHQQIRATQGHSLQVNLTAENAEHQLQAERAQRDQIDAERQALSQQLATIQAEVQSLHDKSTSAASDAVQQASRVETLEDRVAVLNAILTEKDVALNDKDRMLSLDKDFLAHDRDIRDLIGARNLYIADIFDTGQNGKTAKPFGRIFYTKDRSLVFYGFDLDKQAGVAQSASFQVWGSGSDKKTVNLGLFYQDDSHKRWVLRCNDEKALARLNMVFVTVEPPGGSSKPTGKQLLRAYLQIQPNHP